MGSLQKKEAEVLCKFKEQMYTLQIRSCQCSKLPTGANSSAIRKSSGNQSTLSLSHDKCNQAKGNFQGDKVPKEGSIKLSQTFNLEGLMKLSSLNSKHEGPFDSKRFLNAVGAPLDFSISESSFDSRIVDAKLVHPGPVQISTSEAETFNPSRDASLSGDEYVAYTNRNESVKGQELVLSNLSLNGSITLGDISGTNNLLNLINYFPQRPPNFCSRKKLLILDINGILADIVYPPPKGYKADTKIAGRAVFTRPFCSDFLGFCLDRFNVAIWSSRSRKIIDRLINYLMGDMKHRLIFCWDLSHCTASNFRTLENKHKTLVFKELSKVWETHGPDVPWEKGYFNESNTLLLDDTPYKALLNPPHTAIFPYSYDFKNRVDSSLGPRGNIRAYLEELATAENVQEHIEQNPFGQGAITERSLTWHFYDKVIQGHTESPLSTMG